MSVVRFEMELTLKRDMLGTNSGNPNIHDAHVIEKQRKLISEEGTKLNKQINKYLDAVDISEEKRQTEIERLMNKMEATTGYVFSEEQKALAFSGKLESLKETFAELDTKGVTVFFWDKELNRPCIADHMIYGFMKASAEAISKTRDKKNGTVLQSASYTQSLINQHVRISEQMITFDKDIDRGEGGIPNYLQRPLRAMTAQGPRNSLAKSEVVKAGAKLKFVLCVAEGSPLLEKESHLKDIFDYGGAFFGLGQWRNAGYGMFDYKMKKLKH